MLLVETVVLGMVAGTMGALAGAGIVGLWMGTVGLPATTDILVFLFAGPRLYPTVALSNVVFAYVVVLVVSLLATMYPARLATRIQPVVAMQGKE
jgi:ABC-type lipoprotein release transport system permease subunit